MKSFDGLVIRSTGSWYTIFNPTTKENIDARIVGKFRIKGLKLTNPIAVGDIVKIDYRGEEAVIVEVRDRKNYVVRQSPRKKHFLHLLAANVDQAVLVVTIVAPKLKQGFIDRFLLMTEPYDIPVHIVFNKCDLYVEKDLDNYDYLAEIYQKIGYTTQLSSCEENYGIDELRSLLENKITLISGQSGVGKSTLLNALKPELALKTTDISGYSGKGQHTTTFAEMFFVNEQTKIIDSPGIKTLSFNHLEVQDISHNFREFFVTSEGCKFGDCTHRNEPKCAVKESIENGEISELRYNNYLQLIQEVEDQNYWERHEG